MYNQTIADYIQSQKAKGISEAAMVEALVGAGWPQADIDATFKKLNTPDDSKPPVNEKRIEPLHQNAGSSLPTFEGTDTEGNTSTVAGEANQASPPVQNQPSQPTQRQFQPEGKSTESQAEVYQVQSSSIPVGAAGGNPNLNTTSDTTSFSDRSAYISNPFLVLKEALRQPKKAWIKIFLLSFILAVAVSIALPYILGYLLLASFGAPFALAEGDILMALLFVVGLPLLAVMAFAIVWGSCAKIALQAASPSDKISISFKDAIKAVVGITLNLVLAGAIFFLFGFASGAFAPLILLLIPIGIYILIRYTRILSLLPFHQMYEKESVVASTKSVLRLSKKHVAEVLGFLAIMQLISMLLSAVFTWLAPYAMGPFGEINNFMLGVSVFVMYFPTLLLFGLAAFGSAYRYLSLRQLEAGQVSAPKTHPLNYVTIAILVFVTVVAGIFNAENANTQTTFSSQNYDADTTMETDSSETYEDAVRRQEASVVAADLEMYAANNGGRYPLSLNDLYDSSERYDEPETTHLMRYLPQTGSGNICFEEEKCSGYELSVRLSNGSRYSL